jgi:hypothetical protein
MSIVPRGAFSSCIYSHNSSGRYRITADCRYFWHTVFIIHTGLIKVPRALHVEIDLDSRDPAKANVVRAYI